VCVFENEKLRNVLANVKQPSERLQCRYLVLYERKLKAKTKVELTLSRRYCYCCHIVEKKEASGDATHYDTRMNK
jgi:hypothetical protein